MDALNQNDSYTVWFGGSCDEHWSDDYRLTVTYRDRTSVTARLLESGAATDGPLPPSPLAGPYSTPPAGCRRPYGGQKS